MTSQYGFVLSPPLVVGPRSASMRLASSFSSSWRLNSKFGGSGAFAIHLPAGRSSTRKLPTNAMAAFRLTGEANSAYVDVADAEATIVPAESLHLSTRDSLATVAAPEWERRVAVARAITPSRRPSARTEDDMRGFQEEVPVPSGRRTDLMAPKRVGFWSLVPYVAALVTFGAFGFVGVKRFQARQRSLVEDFGEVMVFYADTPEAKRLTVKEYKWKLGPGVLRGALYSSYLRNLVTEKPVGPDAIQDAILVKTLLRISEAKAAKIINSLGASLKASPSLLGKLYFLAHRCLRADAVASLTLVPLFAYGEAVVIELQRNMVDRCFRDLVGRLLDDDEDAAIPLDVAGLLRLEAADAKEIFDGVVAARARAREDQSAVIAAAESEDASKPVVGDLDYPARSGEPAKAAVHAYQCTQCGYTMFPAAGREFKFFGADFVCPTCGAPKDKFTDLNADE